MIIIPIRVCIFVYILYRKNIEKKKMGTNKRHVADIYIHDISQSNQAMHFFPYMFISIQLICVCVTFWGNFVKN